MKNVIIFGDSYCTFEGELPEKHTFYYPKMDVTKKEDTWWWQFFKRSGYKLIYNDSWSGSTIGYTGYNNYDCSKTSSFICRYKKLKNEQLKLSEIFEKSLKIFVTLGQMELMLKYYLGDLSYWLELTVLDI